MLARRTAATLLAVATGGAGLAVALAVPGNAAQTMTLTAKQLYADGEDFVDVNGNGFPDKGDEILVADTLYDSAGHAVGYDRGTCTLIRSTATQKGGPAPEAMCVITVALPGGQLVVTGIDKSMGQDVHAAITGGTGDYAGKGGEAHAVNSTITLTIQ